MLLELLKLFVMEVYVILVVFMAIVMTANMIEKLTMRVGEFVTETIFIIIGENIMVRKDAVGLFIKGMVHRKLLVIHFFFVFRKSRKVSVFMRLLFGLKIMVFLTWMLFFITLATLLSLVPLFISEFGETFLFSFLAFSLFFHLLFFALQAFLFLLTSDFMLSPCQFLGLFIGTSRMLVSPSRVVAWGIISIMAGLHVLIYMIATSVMRLIQVRVVGTRPFSVSRIWLHVFFPSLRDAAVLMVEELAIVTVVAIHGMF